MKLSKAKAPPPPPRFYAIKFRGKKSIGLVLLILNPRVYMKYTSGVVIMAIIYKYIEY